MRSVPATRHRRSGRRCRSWVLCCTSAARCSAQPGCSSPPLCLFLASFAITGRDAGGPVSRFSPAWAASCSAMDFASCGCGYHARTDAPSFRGMTECHHALLTTDRRRDARRHPRAVAADGSARQSRCTPYKYAAGQPRQDAPSFRGMTECHTSCTLPTRNACRGLARRHGSTRTFSPSWTWRLALAR